MKYIISLVLFLVSWSAIAQIKPVDQQYLSNPNVLTNPGFEQGVTTYSRYQDAAGVIPVDMTGGTPHVTITRNTTTPIDGTADMVFAKPTGNYQGEGFSKPFTIPAGLQGQQLEYCFQYRNTSGYSDGADGKTPDMIAYIYDVTNATLASTEPAPRGIMSYAVSTGSTQYCGNFQAAVNSTSYRLGGHISSTNTAVYSMTLDNFRIGKPKSVNGAIVTNWTPTTITSGLTGATGLTVTAYESRQGDTACYTGRINWSAVFTGGTAVLTIPRTIDTTKTHIIAKKVGDVDFWDDGVGGYTGDVFYNSTTSVIMYIHTDDSGASSGYITYDGLSTTKPFTWANADSIGFNFCVPVLGWNSTAVLGQDGATQVISARYTKGAAQSVNDSSATEITFPTKVYDNTNMCNIATGRCTAQVSGKYRVNAMLDFDADADGNRQISVYKNGAAYAVLNYRKTEGTGMSTVISGNALVDLNANDYVSIYAYHTAGNALNTGNVSAIYSWFDIERVSGPATIAASEFVGCSYTTNAGLTLNNNTNTTIIYEDLNYDTHGIYNTSTGVITFPVSGRYEIIADYALAATADFSGTEALENHIYSSVGGTDLKNAGTYPSNSNVVKAANTVIYSNYFIAGSTAVIRGFQESGSNLPLSTNPVRNTLFVKKIY